MRSYLINYGFFGLLRLFRDFILTKIFYKQCRIIRFPFYIRGARFIHFGKGFSTGVNCRIDAFKFGDNNPNLFFGNNVKLNDYVHIAASSKVYIGNNVLIASKVFITDHDHGSYQACSHDILQSPDSREIVSSPTIINDNVWLGENVSVLSGVTIGKNAIIGASSVVTKDIPEYSICIGNPARIIKTYCKERLKWVSV